MTEAEGRQQWQQGPSSPQDFGWLGKAHGCVEEGGEVGDGKVLGKFGLEPLQCMKAADGRRSGSECRQQHMAWHCT